jgi:acyl dehydratase
MDPWTVTAINLPEHRRNAIHTDAGAQAAGFPRALVAGVTTYAYLTHPIVAAWGTDWLAGGGGEVRFRQPVFDGDSVTCAPVAVAGCADVDVEARTDGVRAVLRAWPTGSPAMAMRDGERLPSRQFELVEEWGSDYGRRAGDELSVYGDEDLVHPAVWPAIANQIVHVDVARGAWIHTRSVVRHHAPARAGSVADVHAVVVRRFERSGERAVLDVRIEIDGTVVATLEHEAIVALPVA